MDPSSEFRRGVDFQLVSPSGSLNKTMVTIRESNSSRFGLICWTNGGSQEIDNRSNGLPLHLVTEVKCGRSHLGWAQRKCSSNVDLCLSIHSPSIDLFLIATSVDVRDGLFRLLMNRFETLGAAEFESPGDDPSSPTEESSELLKSMQRGTKFVKFDADAAGKVTNCIILLFAEGVGRSGSLYWVEVNSPLARAAATPLDNRLPLDRITDFMLRKKSPPLKSSKAAEECCFALVTDKYTLNLEAPSKEICKQWKEGLILMLTTAGKQVVKADGAALNENRNNSGSFSMPPAQGMLQPPAAQSNPLGSPATRTRGLSASSAPSSSPSSSPVAPPSSLQPIDEKDRDFAALKDGQVFTLYYANAKGQQEVAKVNIFYVELSGHDSPGALYWCGAGSKKMLDGQRLMLNTLKQMVAGKDQASFKTAVAASSIPPEQCFSIVGKALVLNLEAPSHTVRELWMKTLHSVMVKYQAEVQVKKKASQAAAAAAAAAAIASPDLVAANSNGGASSAQPDDLRALRDGQSFTLYLQAANGDISTHPVNLFFVEGDGPGVLHWCETGKREVNAAQKFQLATITRMVAGKETPPFQSAAAARVPIDRCLSIIGKLFTLNLEAPSNEVRDFWMKSLHQVMLRHGKKATSAQSNANPQPAAPSSPTGSGPVGSPLAPPPVFLPPSNPSPAVPPPSLSVAPPSNSPPPSPSPPSSSSPVNPMGESEAQFLAAGHQFKQYYINPQDRDRTVQMQEVLVYFEALSGSEYPGALLWQPASQVGRVRIDGQKMLLNKIQQMAGGKDTPILKSPAAANAPRDRCLYLNTSAVSLNLEASSPDVKNHWMKNLHQLMIKLGRQTIDEGRRSNGSQSARPIPNSPTSNGNTSFGAKDKDKGTGSAATTMDSKAAIALLTTGQQFNLYMSGEGGAADKCSPYFFFFVTATGSEQPGVVYWCEVGKKDQLPKQRFLLNSVKQMRAGKETPILKSSIASKAKVNCCLSIFASGAVVNVEAPSQDIRDSWMKSLHTVLVKHGMKAVEESQEPSASPSSSPNAPGSARALKEDQLGSSQLNRTINFMDPTEFFSIQAKIGEGSYGAVYKALDHRDGNSVAIKVIPFSGKDSLKLRKEIRVLKQCNCPFIVGYKGAFHKNDNVWIVMEYCFTPDHQVLTKSGWKFFTEVDMQTEVATYDECSREMVYQHPTKLIHNEVRDQRMVEATKNSKTSSWDANSDEYGRNPLDEEFSNSRISIVTTDEHDWYVKLGRVKPCGKVNWALKDLNGGEAKFHKVRGSTLVSQKDFTHFKLQTNAVEGLFNDDKENTSAHFRSKLKLLSETEVDGFIELYGFWLGVGWVEYREEGSGCDSVGFNPQNDFDKKYLKDLLTKVCLKKDIDYEESNHSDGTLLVKVTNQCWFDYFHSEYGWKYESGRMRLMKIGRSMEKDLDAQMQLEWSSQKDFDIESAKWFFDWVWGLGRTHLRLLINGLNVADGVLMGGEATKGNCISTSSVAFRDMLQRVLLHAGYSAYWDLFDGSGRGHGADGNAVVVRPDHWRVHWNEEVTDEVFSADDLKSVTYTGMTHCVTVPNGLIFVRRTKLNDKGVVTCASRPVIMGNCAAGSLSDIMQICKRTLSEQQVACVMRMCLAGLAYLHGQGKIHRDIKGGNLLANQLGLIKLADFGVSGNLDKTLGKHRTVIGTPHWMAPEVLMSDDYNELADIWSLGITAYELAIGEPPHAKLHSMRAALKIPMSPPPTLPDPTHWSADFHSFLAACLVKDFNNRPSAAQLLSHPFIAKAPSHTVLMDIVTKAVQTIEAKAQHDVTTADVINKPQQTKKRPEQDGDSEELDDVKDGELENDFQYPHNGPQPIAEGQRRPSQMKERKER